MSTKERAVGKRAAPRGSIGSLGRLLCSFRKVAAVPADAPLWVMVSNVAEFPGLFSSTLGTAVSYEIKLLDSTPVRFSQYRRAPPKMAIFRQIVNELLEQGVLRPRKSPYSSPAFLVPKKDGGFRMVLDYRNVNAKIVFDSYPMPTVGTPVLVLSVTRKPNEEGDERVPASFPGASE